MPTIRVETNVKVADEKDFVLGFSKVRIWKHSNETATPSLTLDVKLASETLKTPEALFGVILQQNQTFCFAGSLEPCFSCSLTGITVGNPGVNQAVVREFTKYLEKKLGVSNDRGYVFLQNPGANNVGFKGETCDIVFAK
ncbi:hypothetical protein E1B28_013158 [Marasmius oreades]|uniref:L-dopachrome isomerase n=1 Tax=Marasmius oreades TaxID=181124 RepID=A0A9P7RPB6_9AGAR|nr:uncharacterized protein E1B28_013158 [Marasmius oreades]KAG7087177.1 hypothetical protein E1B28_013158 [Marasmius oreades]